VVGLLAVSWSPPSTVTGVGAVKPARATREPVTTTSSTVTADEAEAWTWAVGGVEAGTVWAAAAAPHTVLKASTDDAQARLVSRDMICPSKQTPANRPQESVRPSRRGWNG
jgi:hypothetical protein